MPYLIEDKNNEITEDELAKHNKEGDAWIAIDGHVYDVSKFAELHPGAFSARLSLLLTNGLICLYCANSSCELALLQKQITKALAQTQ